MVTGWTLDTLHEHLDQRLDAADRAVMKAEAAADKRFESVNEFREQLREQAATLMPRAEAEARIASIDRALDEHVARATLQFANIEQRFTSRVDVLAGRVDVAAGHTTGIAAGWGYLVGIVGIAASIVAVVLALTRT